jgi:hypothetical protein
VTRLLQRKLKNIQGTKSGAHPWIGWDAQVPWSIRGAVSGSTKTTLQSGRETFNTYLI